MNVSLVSITAPAGGQDLSPEELIVHIARVSNPANQDNHATAPRLLRYLIQHKHWSPFEMVDITVEITTSRAIAAQLLRHRSFSFQEFSQRYANVADLETAGAPFEDVELRVKAGSNRQGSGMALAAIHGENVWISDDLEVTSAHIDAIRLAQSSLDTAWNAYRALIDAGIAPECARMVLPLATQTRLYMKGSLRSWIHFLQARLDSHAQKEARDIAQAVAAILAPQFPNTFEALALANEAQNPNG